MASSVPVEASISPPKTPKVPPPLPPFPNNIPSSPSNVHVSPKAQIDSNGPSTECVTEASKEGKKAPILDVANDGEGGGPPSPAAEGMTLIDDFSAAILAKISDRGIHAEDFPEYVGMGLAEQDGDVFTLDSDSSESENEEEEVKVLAKDRWKKALRKVQLVQSMGSVAKDKVNRALEEKRVHARTELLESEKEYYNLELQNMESESSTSPALADLTPSQAVQVRAVFGNISQIRDLTKHLLDDLEPTIKNDGKLGPVFVNLAPYFRMYLAYYQTYDESRIALNELKTKAWFHCYLNALEAQPTCNHRRLGDFLIEPVQRVPRYEMLIKEILKYTPPGHPFVEELKTALQQVKQVADSMNFEMKSSDLRLKVASLSVQWQGVDFTAAHRTFVKEGDLIKTNRRGVRQKYRLLLFNDLLAMGLEKGDNRFKLHLKAPLRDCLLVDDTHVYSRLGAMPLHDADTKRPTNKLERAMLLANAPTKGGATAGAWKLMQSSGLSLERVLESQVDEKSFIVQANEKTLYLTAESSKEKRDWISALSNAVIEQTSEVKEHKGRRVSLLTYQPPSESPTTPSPSAFKFW